MVAAKYLRVQSSFNATTIRYQLRLDRYPPQRSHGEELVVVSQVKIRLNIVLRVLGKACVTCVHLRSLHSPLSLQPYVPLSQSRISDLYKP